MRAQARASHMVTLSFALVMAVSSSASALGESESRPSRGPKHSERDEPTRPEPRRDPSREDIRPTPQPPARNRPGASRPVPTSVGPGDRSERPRGGTPQASDNGDTRSEGDPNAGGAGLTGPSSRPDSASTSGRPAGGGSRPRGSSRLGNGGNRSRSAPGGGAGHGPAGGTGGPARFRIGPGDPPGGRDRMAVGVARPAMAWGSSRASKAALISSPAILASAVVPPSTAEVSAAALGQPGPLPRTGSEINPSAALALVLLVLGRVLRRTAR